MRRDGDNYIEVIIHHKSIFFNRLLGTILGKYNLGKFYFESWDTNTY